MAGPGPGGWGFRAFEDGAVFLAILVFVFLVGKVGERVIGNPGNGAFVGLVDSGGWSLNVHQRRVMPTDSEPLREGSS